MNKIKFLKTSLVRLSTSPRLLARDVKKRRGSCEEQACVVMEIPCVFTYMRIQRDAYRDLYIYRYSLYLYLCKKTVVAAQRTDTVYANSLAHSSTLLKKEAR